METLDFIQQNLDLNDCDRDGQILLSPTKLCMLLDDFCELQEADSDTKPLKKGSYVTRAAYAKLQGEKKRLEKDIYILCHEKYSISAERLIVLMRWRDKFRDDENFRAMLKQAAIEYIVNNPDRGAAQIWREHTERLQQLQELDNHPQM